MVVVNYPRGAHSTLTSPQLASKSTTLASTVTAMPPSTIPSFRLPIHIGSLPLHDEISNVLGLLLHWRSEWLVNNDSLIDNSLIVEWLVKLLWR